MRKRRPTPNGIDVRKRLAAKLESMGWEEIFDLVEQMIPHGCSQRVMRETPISVTGPTLVVAKRLGKLIEDYSVEEVINAKFGFLPGPARKEYLEWYVERTLPPSRRGFFSIEMSKLAGLQQLRRLMRQARMI